MSRDTVADSPSHGTVPLETVLTKDTVTITDANGLEVAHWTCDEIDAAPDVAFAIARAVDRAHATPKKLLVLAQHQPHLAAQIKTP